MYRLPVFFVFAATLFAQLETNTITVTASRTVNLPPDQVLFALTVDTPTTASLADVLGALQGAGITLANFSGVNQPNSLSTSTAGPSLEWTFGVPVPFSKMQDTAMALSSLKQAIAQSNPTFVLNFAASGSITSQGAQQGAACSAVDLLSDARAQAQRLADAAGVALGNMLTLSSSTTSTNAQASVVTAYSFSLFSVYPTAATAPGCSLTVKFGFSR